MAKKRKAEEHTATLHDFFGRASSAKRKRASGTATAIKRSARTHPAEEEIIEITDSEEEGPPGTTMEVQPESQISEGFGKPSGFLFHWGPQSQDTAGYIEETQKSNFVPITPDSAGPLEPLALQHADSSFNEGDSEGYESSSTYVTTGGDDEWGMGDDERVTRIDVNELEEPEEPEEELDDEGKVVLPPESQENGGSEGHACPLCGRDLSAFDEEVRSQNFV
jgi:hypothetical protein